MERVRWAFVPQIYTYNNEEQEIIPKLGRRSAQKARIHGQSQKDSWEPSLVVSACTLSIQEAEIGPSGARGQPWLIGEKKKEKKGSKDSSVDFVNAGKLKLCNKKRRKEILLTIHLSAYKAVAYIGKTLRKTGPRVKSYPEETVANFSEKISQE